MTIHIEDYDGEPRLSLSANFIDTRTMNIYGERPAHKYGSQSIGRDMRRLLFKGCTDCKATVTGSHADSLILQDHLEGLQP